MKTGTSSPDQIKIEAWKAMAALLVVILLIFLHAIVVLDLQLT